MSVLAPIFMERGKLGILTMMALFFILDLIVIAIWVVTKYILDHEKEEL